MSVPRGTTMEEKMSGTNSFRGILSHVVRAIALSLLFALTMSGTAQSQNVAVSGTVTSTAFSSRPPRIAISSPSTSISAPCAASSRSV